MVLRLGAGHPEDRDILMRRRDFIAGLGGAAFWPLAARAQQPPAPVIGWLSVLSSGEMTSLVAEFREGLKGTGYVEGRNLTVESRWADGQYARISAMTADLVGRKVAVILAASPPAALAAKAATTTIPIVFVSGLDPVKAGIVTSLSLPGGNITGVSLVTSALGAKRLEILRELVPAAHRIAVLLNPGNPNFEVQSTDIQAVARASDIELHLLNASSEGEVDAAFSVLAVRRPDALVVGADPLFTGRRHQIVALAARNAIPAIYDWRQYTDAGGLMSYGTSLTAAYHEAGVYVGRILKGTAPAELPVIQSSTYELVINLKTAKSLGLTVPRVLRARADDLIE
jgi:putative ABC transport system substrate-binding protein